jgi:PAS domain S-box-containing protein
MGDPHASSIWGVVYTNLTMMTGLMKNAKIAESDLQTELTALRKFIVQLKEDAAKHTRYEDALRESEQRFKTLAEASFEGLALTENGVIVDYNDQLGTVLGYTRQELLGKHVMELVAPESRDLVAGKHRLQHEGPYEHIALRKDGSTLLVEVRARFMRIGVRDVRLAAIRDISERQRAQAALQAERNLLRTLIDNLPDLIYFKDNQGRYVLNNLAHLRSIGVERQEDVQGKTTFDFNPHELAKKYFDDEMEIVRTGKAIIGKEEIAVHRDTGEERWHLTSKVPILNAQGEVTGIVGISRDITLRKQLEEQRDHYVKELQEALESVQTLSGMLPICAECKKIRDDKGYWQQVEGYIMNHSSARFTHGLCPECMARTYPNFSQKERKN